MKPSHVIPPAMLRDTTRRVRSRIKNMGLSWAEAAGIVAPLEREGDHVFAITRGQASMIDLSLAVMDKVGEPCDLTVWTWVVADYELQYVQSLIDDSRVSAFRLVCDQGCIARRPDFIASVRRRFGHDAVRVTVNHSKIAMVRGPAGDVLIRGSMNFNANLCMEQVDITWSAELCDWMEGVMDQLWALAPAPTDDVDRGDLAARMDALL